MTGDASIQLRVKQAVVRSLESNDLESIESIARWDRTVLSLLVRLAYDKDTLTGWRAITAIGRVASWYARNDYAFLRETVRKLLWSLSDESGGIGWSAPEILGEIVSADPEKFADIVPLIAEVFSIEERVFRPGVLYALKRISEIRPEAITPYHAIVLRGLSEQDPLARVYALELIKRLKGRIARQDLDSMKLQIDRLIHDRAEAWVYRNDGFFGQEVGEIARDVLKYLQMNAV